MRNALLLSAVLAALASPGLARADVAPAPVVLHVDGETTAVASGVSPDRAAYRLRNASSEEVEVFFYRAILRVDGTNIPMEITSVETEAGVAPGRTVSVPPRGQARVTVVFELPERYRSRREWDVDVRITSNGPGGSSISPAHLTRARTGGAERKWASGPK